MDKRYHYSDPLAAACHIKMTDGTPILVSPEDFGWLSVQEKSKSGIWSDGSHWHTEGRIIIQRDGKPFFWPEQEQGETNA